jgi:hypothetical protein
VLLDFRKRSCWIARASITRSRIDPDGSPLGVAADSSRKSTNGTSMCKSIRSNNGPLIRCRYCSICREEHRHSRFGSP